jgi:hypothetical protein
MTGRRSGYKASTLIEKKTNGEATDCWSAKNNVTITYCNACSGLKVSATSAFASWRAKISPSSAYPAAASSAVQ